VAEAVDHQVRALIDQAHTEAWTVLTSNRAILDTLATELLEKETLDHNQLAKIFATVKKLPERPQWLSSALRPVSTKGPVAIPAKKKTRAVAKSPVKKTIPATPRAKKSADGSRG
jgi:cell division protease FtsH